MKTDEEIRRFRRVEEEEKIDAETEGNESYTSREDVGGRSSLGRFATKSGRDVLLMIALIVGASLSAQGASDRNDVSEIGNRKGC
jgi:hypothetical protein